MEMKQVLILERRSASKTSYLHAGGDATGKNLLEHLIQEVAPYVTVVEQEMVLDFIIEKDKCVGALTRNNKGE